MGQKSNPTSLRLKTTNKNFDSCWYGDLHYSTLWSLELQARSYIEKVFEQIRYPKPSISLSLIPKRGKILIFYLNPERSRGQRGKQFQLKPSLPLRGIGRRGYPLPTRPTALAEAGLTRAGAPSSERFAERATSEGASLGRVELYPSRKMSLLGTFLAGSSSISFSHWRRGRASEDLPFGASHLPKSAASGGATDGINRGWPRLRYRSQQEGLLSNWGRSFLLYSTLLSISKRKSNATRLLFDKDFALLHRVQRLICFQGREESYLLSINQRQSTNQRQSINQQPLLDGTHQPLLDGTHQPLLDGTHQPLLDRTHNDGGAGGRLKSVNRSHGRETPSPANQEEEVLLGRRGFGPGMGVEIKGCNRWLHAGTLLDSAPHNLARSSIREIRRQDVQSSICLMEEVLGRGLGVHTTLYPYKSIEEEQSAQFLSEEIAYYLERRIPFRRIKQALMRELQTRYIEGVRVSCSGRVGGRSKKAQRARVESFQWGQTSCHVFSSKLSFAYRSALTPFGKVGIKVWICYK